jgi:hypothetical protein
MLYKRYQYFSREGKVWTKWFPWSSDMMDKWQTNNKLLNEYKEESELSPEEKEDDIPVEPKKKKKKTTKKTKN